jgi:hypothetical protein
MAFDLCEGEFIVVGFGFGYSGDEYGYRFILSVFGWFWEEKISYLGIDFNNGETFIKLIYEFGCGGSFNKF